MNSKGFHGPRRTHVPTAPTESRSSDQLRSVNKSREDQVSAEHRTPQLSDFLYGSDLSTAGRVQLLRTQTITDPNDREALVKRIAYYQWWVRPNELYSEHVLRATMLKHGLPVQVTNKILLRQALTHPSDRMAFVNFIDKLVPQRSSGGGGTSPKKRGK